MGGTPPVDTSPTGICRTNEAQEWELLSNWNLQSNLGLNWSLGELLLHSCRHGHGSTCIWSATSPRVTLCTAWHGTARLDLGLAK